MSSVDTIIKKILTIQDSFNIDLEDPLVKKENLSEFVKLKKKVDFEINSVKDVLNKLILFRLLPKEMS